MLLAAVTFLGLLKLGQVQTLQSETALALQEAQRLRELERVIDERLEKFLKVGAALLEIRTARLYRATHARWKDYCLARLGAILVEVQSDRQDDQSLRQSGQRVSRRCPVARRDHRERDSSIEQAGTGVADQMREHL